MSENKKSNYDSSNIQVLHGLDPVRKRPAMYIGGTDLSGLHHLVYEVVDNSVDEALAGFCDVIQVVLNSDGSVTITDNGRGIPVDPIQDPPDKKHADKPAVEIVLTTLHAGGKFDNTAYKLSGGLHGVGVSCVNALSERLIVDIFRNGYHYHQEYKIGSPTTDLKKMETTKKTGTSITFFPDQTIFEDVNFSFEVLSSRLRELAFLNAGTTISILDSNSGKDNTFQYKGGISDFIQHILENKSPLYDNPCCFSDTYEERVKVEVAFQHHAGYSEQILTFVNNISTVAGGGHLAGFKTAVTRSIQKYLHIAAEKNTKYRNIKIIGDDTREGLWAIVSIYIPDPQFQGQTKSKLVNNNVEKAVESIVLDKFTQFLEENPKITQKILDKSLEAVESRNAAKKARELIRKKGVLESSALPGKLADCREKDIMKREIFIVEGDSAGGSAKQGRDRHTQAILPLKGKILNVEKSALSKFLSNEEIRILIVAIGLISDVKKKDMQKENVSEEETLSFEISKIRYGKIIIMTDADVDGSHIRTLLLTFFFRQMKILFDLGFIYIAQPPLYRVSRGKLEEYLAADLDLDIYLLKDAFQYVRMSGITDLDGDVAHTRSERLLFLITQFESLIHDLKKRGIFVNDIVLYYEQGKFPIAQIVDRETYIKKNIYENVDLEQETAEKYIQKLDAVQNIRAVIDELKDYHLYIDKQFSVNDTFLYTLSYRNKSVDMTSQILGDFVQILRNFAKNNNYIQRYKGLGEMNPEQLWETTMDPEKRVLLQVKVDDEIEADNIFFTLMGDKVKQRKEFIEKHALSVKNLDI